MSGVPPSARSVTLVTADNYSISARIYESTDAVRGQLIVAGATGVGDRKSVV